MTSSVLWKNDGTTPGTAEQLNGSALWKVANIAALKALNTTGYSTYSNDRDVYIQLRYSGLCFYDSGASLTADELSVFDATAGSGNWILDTPGFNLVEAMIQEYISPLLDEIDQLKTEMDRLTALSVNTLETVIISDFLYIPAIATVSSSEILIPVAPDRLAELRASDMVTVCQFPIPAGLVMGGVSIQGNCISIRLHNPTAGGITPGFTPITIKIERVFT